MDGTFDDKLARLRERFPATASLLMKDRLALPPVDFDAACDELLTGCHGNAKPGEPTFTLLGRDPAAGLAVLFWAELRERLDIATAEEFDKIDEAKRIGRAMVEWAVGLGKGVNVVRLAMWVVTSAKSVVYEVR